MLKNDLQYKFYKRPQLIHHHSVQYESKNIPRPEVQRSNSLPRGLHNAHTVHG